MLVSSSSWILLLKGQPLEMLLFEGLLGGTGSLGSQRPVACSRPRRLWQTRRGGATAAGSSSGVKGSSERLVFLSSFLALRLPVLGALTPNPQHYNDVLGERNDPKFRY